MADGLFDNRYRYDFIYPRGRSGETLRALDSQDGDRPVVVKRPAPNDAPPIRAGQEVSILNERKALSRLSGHPVLTELLGEGQFVSGGVSHQYIVMERAEGRIIADMVRELAREGERLPHLEMLVVVDSLLDLLIFAHARDIIYNDVDAKHLFWDREHYRLKVIDWGNAVFLEGDEVTPQGISRQTDVYQVGELLYFILSGGGRVEVPRDAADDFLLNFGDDTERIAPRLQAIVSRAVHPNTKNRYQSLNALRDDLTGYRRPFESERDGTITRVRENLRRTLSKNELRGLMGTLDPVLARDPGHPVLRDLRAQITDRLRDLDVSADLDAVRIYMESGNWSRANDLLRELREKAGAGTSGTVRLLMEFSTLLVDTGVQPPPPAILDAVGLIFDEHPAQAASVLLTTETTDGRTRRLQWLLAERISSAAPEVILLRPNLYRLGMAMANLDDEETLQNVQGFRQAQAMLDEVNGMLDDMPGTRTTDLAQLLDGYRTVVERLNTMVKVLATVSAQNALPNRKLPLNSLDRALIAAMNMADNMHVIGKQAARSPRDAMVALDSSRAIDPTNPLWDNIGRMLNGLYELLQGYQTYVPSADGSDLDTWLVDAYNDLTPFSERLFDDLLDGMVEGLAVARDAWRDYAAAAIQGGRAEAVTALETATGAVETLSPTLAGWLGQLRSVVNGAQYVERHAIHGGLGRALADGWGAFDRGRLADAERLGQQALDIARNEAEQHAARRLLRTADLARDWVDRSGALSDGRTQTVLDTLEELYTENENHIRHDFAAQMPSRETYLKAMQRGIVERYSRTNSAGLRIFFLDAVMRGTLEAHDGNLDDAGFWREVAIRALNGMQPPRADGDDEQPNTGARHPAVRGLSDFIQRREDLNTAAVMLNHITGPAAVESLETNRRQLEDNAQARLLAPAAQSLRELELALRDWADGEFRAAGIKLENALKAVDDVKQSAGVDADAYREWLAMLAERAADLHTTARTMRQTIERRSAEPDPAVREAHHHLADETERLLGPMVAATLVNWRDTYEQFLDAYTDRGVRRSGRLARLNELFKAMFIDRHPAYPLYRQWYDATENAPEFPAPPTDEPTPRIEESADNADDAFIESRYGSAEPPPEARRLPLRLLFAAIVVLLLVVVVIAAVIVLNSGGDDNTGASGDSPPTALPTLESGAGDAGGDDPAAIAGGADASSDNGTSRAAALAPTATNTPEPPTATPTLMLTPTITNTPEPPTATSTPTNTPEPTVTPTPTIPPGGVVGNVSLLERMTGAESYPWDVLTFAPDVDGEAWRLGVGDASSDEELFVTFPAELLDTFYGNDAPTRMRRSEILLDVETYNPALLDTDDAYFGLLLQSADDAGITAGIYVQITGPNAISLWLRSGTGLEFFRNFSVNTFDARLRLERDPVSGEVAAFFNNSLVGAPLPFIPPDAAAQPVLFVHPGVIASVTEWQVGLR